MPELHGFELLREQDLPELRTRAFLHRHRRTGAELLSLVNDDENKVFGITFRTPPRDSTGVAHIMEHAVLCGSRKYPVKDPFVQLIKGSLNTFLNAMTFPDKTCYPVASQNLQDFYNLIDVYLDAVFHPLLTPLKLHQEGWHYELEKLQDSPALRGIVFNEMKGSYSSPDRLLGEYSQQLLFPGHVYGVDAGGHPRHIPELTYEAFLQFHRTYYHPSNARIFFYGDDDPETRLQLLEAYLRNFDRLPVDSSIPLHPHTPKPQRFTRLYAAGEEDSNDQKGMVTVNWLLPETNDPETTLAMGILAHVLVGTPAAPLHKALIDSGLGEDLAGVGLEGELRQMYFSTGLKGIAVADAGKVEDLILQTLASLADQGIDRATVEASLNTVEFHLRENNTGSYPRGLLLMLRALTTWLHDGDPLAPLAFESPLAAIKSRVARESRFFENMIRQHFLENAHRTTVILKPDPDLARREQAEEKERLEAVRQGMSKDELQAVIDGTLALKRWQETPDGPEALATLPLLKRTDLDLRNKTIPLEVRAEAGTPVLYHDLFTNGIVYFDLGFNLRALPQAYLPYVPLFSRALLEMGTEKEDFVQLSQRIGRKTGGIVPATFTALRHGTTAAVSWLFLRGKAMAAQAEELLTILQEVLLQVRLDDQERFRQMVWDEKAGEEAGLVPHGHGVVNSRLRARFNEADWIAEQMGGVSYLFFLRELVERVENDWPGVLATLEDMRRLLLNRQAMICNLTVEAGTAVQFMPLLTDFLAALPSTHPELQTWQPAYNRGFEALTIPAQVNYVAKGANLFALGYTFHGSALVISNFLRTTWLWERVRMQGGAYGGFCSFDRRSGVFSYVSYRDPNLLQTLANYDAASRFLREVELNEDELTKSIIGTIGDLDAYQLPDAKGYTSLVRHLAGDTDEQRQLMRDQILSTTAADFRRFAGVLEQVNQQGVVIVMGSPAAIAAVNQQRNSWLPVTKVL